MFKKTLPIKPITGTKVIQFPHCDPRILHAVGECCHCDKHPYWQALRLAWGIAFTGYTPEGTELPCPADAARGNKHEKWPGNQAQSVYSEMNYRASIKQPASLTDPGGLFTGCPMTGALGASTEECTCLPGWGHKAAPKSFGAMSVNLADGWGHEKPFPGIENGKPPKDCPIANCRLSGPHTHISEGGGTEL